jgi:Flp pilus assembly pilin Flp
MVKREAENWYETVADSGRLWFLGEGGVTATEYALIAGVVSIGILVGILVLSGTAYDIYVWLGNMVLDLTS